MGPIICLILSLTFCLCSCSAMPEFFKAADDVLTDDAITVKVDRDAFMEDTDVHVIVDVVHVKSASTH